MSTVQLMYKVDGMLNNTSLILEDKRLFVISSVTSMILLKQENGSEKKSHAWIGLKANLKVFLYLETYTFKCCECGVNNTDTTHTHVTNDNTSLQYQSFPRSLMIGVILSSSDWI